jgi:uncharacterized protein YndB with AHSA1/START domain
MPPIVSHIDIACPPAEVFGYATDPTRFAEWQDDVVGVRIQGGRRLGVGSRFTTTRRVARVQFSYTQEITALDPPRSWAARGVDGPLRPSASITVEPLEKGSWSRVTFTLEFQGKGIGKLVPDVVRQLALKGAPKSYQHLKQRLERSDWRAAGRAGAMPPANGRAV